MIPTANAALARLAEGNSRFVLGRGRRPGGPPPLGRGSVADQEPMAIVLGCSDSRVPAEVIFDQGFGDLFVIRVAGNIVAPSQLGSVEFAAARFGTRLVVVLGHSHCGAVAATLEGLGPADAPTPSIGFIVQQIRPALEPLVGSGLTGAELKAAAVRANVEASVRRVLSGSPLLADLAANAGLAVRGAVYDLETGRVNFL